MLVLSLTAALAQGVSVGFLIPVMQFVDDKTIPEGGVWRALHWAFDLVNLEVNLPGLLIGVLIMIVLAQLLLYTQRSQSIKLRERLTAQLRSTTFNSLLEADMAFLQKAGRGNMVNMLTTEANLAAKTIQSFVEFAARSMLVAVYVGLLVAISWQISLGGLGLVLLGSLLVQYQIRRAGKLGKRLVQIRTQFQEFVAERLEAVRLVKLTAMEEKEKAEFRSLSEDLSVHTHIRAKSSSQIRLIMEPAIIGGGLLVLYLSVETFNVSLALLAVFMYVLVRLSPEAMNINQLWHGMAASSASLEKVYAGLEESTARTTVVNGTRPFTGLNKGITLEDVECSYDNSAPVLRGISTTIPKGKLTAIIGPSGVGKSTLLDLLVRLADPTSGTIYIDDVDIKEYDLSMLRPHIGMASQDVMLLSDSIMANLKYGNPDSSIEDVEEAVGKANASRFIESLPAGYDSVLGFRGLTISGGERQRLALARALVGKPSILLLDEVTANLDAESRALIHQSIQRVAKETTVVVSTHDLALIELADKVIVLEEGRVVEEGTPEELMKGGGLFRKYFSYINA